MKTYGVVIGSVTEFVVTVLVCLFLGRWLDKHFDTGNLCIAVGTVGGFIGGITRLAINLKRVMDKQ